MSISSWAKRALGVCAVTLLARCGGGSQLQSPPTGLIQNGAQSGMSGIALPVHRGRGKSWMAPDAKNEDLLYVADAGTNDVDVYSWPAGKVEGTLAGFSEPEGECVDKAGDIWITNTFESDILEYAHGGASPIATLSDPNQLPADASERCFVLRAGVSV